MNQAKHLPLWGIYALLAYMPFHVFLSQSMSLVTGGLSAWKITKDVLTVLLVLLCVVMVWRKRAHKGTKYNVLIAITAAYAAIHLLVYLINKDTSPDIAALATMYNLRLFGYLIIGASVALLWGKKLPLDKIIKLVIVVSTIVSLIGFVQYFLPQDILTHFGYSDARGAKPSFLIDNKADLPRVFSTLREPNSLGAFLVVPILLLTYKFFSGRQRLLAGGLLILHGLVLLLTFSRSAWLTLVIAESVFLFAMYRQVVSAFLKRHMVWLVFGIVFVIGGAFVLRDQYFVQNVIFHADENTIDEGSTDKHFDSIEQGTDAILDKPLGYGPGTAGPVSHHSDEPIITENYYVQLGHEIGVIGLMLFVAVCVLLLVRLQKIATPDARILYAALIGYAICNLFLHTWSNEAVALQWWLLAGLIVANKLPPLSAKNT